MMGIKEVIYITRLVEVVFFLVESNIFFFIFFLYIFQLRLQWTFKLMETLCYFVPRFPLDCG